LENEWLLVDMLYREIGFWPSPNNLCHDQNGVYALVRKNPEVSEINFVKNANHKHVEISGEGGTFSKGI
jgi:hypothetical protein